MNYSSHYRRGYIFVKVEDGNNIIILATTIVEHLL